MCATMLKSFFLNAKEMKSVSWTMIVAVCQGEVGIEVMGASRRRRHVVWCQVCQGGSRNIVSVREHEKVGLQWVFTPETQRKKKRETRLRQVLPQMYTPRELET